MNTKEKAPNPTQTYTWNLAPSDTPGGISPSRRSSVMLALGISCGFAMLITFLAGKAQQNSQIDRLQSQLRAETARAENLNHELYDAKLQLNEGASDRAQLQTIRELICGGQP